MDLNTRTQAQRIYDVFHWLNTSSPPTGNLQLVNDIADIETIMQKEFANQPLETAKRNATLQWMAIEVFPVIMRPPSVVWPYPEGKVPPWNPLND